MSLRPDDRKSRSRSKSPGRARERSRSNVRAPSPGPQYYAQPAGAYASQPSAEHGYATEATPQYEVRQPGGYGMPPQGEAITMGNYADLPPEQRPGYMQQAQQAAQYQYAANSGGAPPASYAQPNVQYATTSGQYGYTTAPATQTQGGAGFQYAPPPTKITFTSKPVVPTAQPPPAVRHTPNAHPQQQPQQQQPAVSHYPSQQEYYSTMPPPPPGPPPQHQQQQQQQQPPAQQYAANPAPDSQQSRPEHRRTASQQGPSKSYDGHKIVEMVPQGGGRMNAPPSPGLRPHSLSVSGSRPDSLSNRMDRLSVSGNRPDIQTIVPGGYPGGSSGLPPPSPMLEAYHGVYQSISPMPQAMMLPDDDIDHLPPLDSLSPRASSSSFQSGGGGRRRAHSSASRRSPSPPSHRSKPRDKLALAAYGSLAGASSSGREKEKRVKIYDATQDALDLVDALASRTPDAETLIDILPALSHDQMLELRAEYKRHCKVQGRGINIAKHIKMKMPSGNFGKICYVTALGRWESEGYWANFWYQSGNARRELLIEALMGRQNYEIREIKAAFKDKRYGDSLTKCMDKELKADKFRKAVLLALEAERQEESDVWEPEYRERDVETLYRALKAREGGESAMLGIVVTRSDAHLRDVLRGYERRFGGNFAREALRKSGNLVGEVIAHILNGIINRPARDAMLLHHALTDLIDSPRSSSPRRSGSNVTSTKDSSSSRHARQQRYELLISRLVRLHWDRLHLSRVKREYDEKYGRVLEEDIEVATKGDFRDFCLHICQTS